MCAQNRTNVYCPVHAGTALLFSLGWCQAEEKWLIGIHTLKSTFQVFHLLQTTSIVLLDQKYFKNDYGFYSIN